MPSERGLPPGSGADGEPSSAAGQADAELDKALEGFDGEILAEREIIKARSNETAGSQGTPAELPGGPGAGGAGERPAEPQTGGQQDAPVIAGGGVPRQNNSSKAPPMANAGSQVPKDIPDARDDDIIARQLREAAMNESDPELREKLWEEYKRYKGA